jgi:hypothetical protein
MRRFLFAYVVAMGLQAGAGVFVSAVVFPVWAASPEAVMGWKPTMPYFIEEGRFFMFASPLVTLLALILVIANRRFPAGVRGWILYSAVTLLVMSLWTMAYFLPEQGRVHGAAGARLPSQELAAALERFLTLNWIRQAFLLSAFVAAVHALGLCYRAPAPAASRQRTASQAPKLQQAE